MGRSYFANLVSEQRTRCIKSADLLAEVAGPMMFFSGLPIGTKCNVLYVFFGGQFMTDRNRNLGV